MLWVDNVIVFVIVLCAVIGIVRGLLGEMLSLAGWLLAISTGLLFNQEFSLLLAIKVANPAVKMAFSFVGLWYISLLMANTVSSLVREGLDNNRLGFYNRFWAMIFGGLHGILILATLVLLAGLSPLPTEAWWQDALLIPPLQSLAISLRDHIPSEMAAYINYH